MGATELDVANFPQGATEPDVTPPSSAALVWENWRRVSPTYLAKLRATSSSVAHDGQFCGADEICESQMHDRAPRLVQAPCRAIFCAIKTYVLRQNSMSRFATEPNVASDKTDVANATKSMSLTCHHDRRGIAIVSVAPKTSACQHKCRDHNPIRHSSLAGKYLTEQTNRGRRDSQIVAMRHPEG